MELELRLLGNVEASIGGRLLDVGPARQRCVLAVLLAEPNQVITTDQLLDRIWGEDVPLRAKNTLRSYLTRLRQVFDGMEGFGIGRRSGGYVVAVDEQTVDLHRFRALVAEADAVRDDADVLRALGKALALWRGEAFAGLNTAWISELRGRLETERIAAELDHAEIALRCGRHQELLPDLAARCAARPLDERLASQYALALYRSGRQADALLHYEQLRRRLADELGADTSPALQRLHQEILRGDPAAADTVAPPRRGTVHVRSQAVVPPVPVPKAHYVPKATYVLTVVGLLFALVMTVSSSGTAPFADGQDPACPAVLREGDHGPCVKQFQERLQDAGLSLPNDGQFGPYTFMRLLALQTWLGLPRTGQSDQQLIGILSERTTRVPVWSPDEVERRVREVFPEQPQQAVDVVQCLSYRDPLWISLTDGVRRWGLFQFSDLDLRDALGGLRSALDPERNIQLARARWNQTRDFSYWRCAPHSR